MAGSRGKLRKGRGQRWGWSLTNTDRAGGKGPGGRISLGEISGWLWRKFPEHQVNKQDVLFVGD